MGLLDFEVFIKERLAVFDSGLDLSPGSPIDVQLVQPLLRRLGVDPFTLDAATFITERLSQEYPDIAGADGDAISDLLTKPALLLWDPIIREIQRVKSSQSLRDPSTLTLDEADALGANIFAKRRLGEFARGTGRIYFAQPQPISISQSNFFTSRSGLHYFPVDIQSIRAEEMLLNSEGSLYYFDVNLIAERAGDQYNIGSLELVTVANVAAAVRVTNKVRFRSGLAEMNAETFIGEIDQSLSERSLVTTRGIGARLTAAFPEISRLNVVGMGDPEMQRDILSGGSLGPMLAFGTDASSAPDGEAKPTTRRLRVPSADFLSLIGPPGTVTGWVLTLFPPSTGPAFLEAPFVRDLPIARVVDGQTLDVTGQVLRSGVRDAPWAIRKMELTVSGIPGGILFPDGPSGTVAVTADKVHIGGCTDILVRGLNYDSSSLLLDIAKDDTPANEGLAASLVYPDGYVELQDLELGVNYAEEDPTWLELESAGKYHYSLEILDGVGAGVYRILKVEQLIYPRLYVLPAFEGVIPGTFRWRLVDSLHIDLVEPKQTRLRSGHGRTLQNVAYFTTDLLPKIDFSALGVSVGDTLRIFEGSDKGDFVIEDVPLATKLTVNRPFTHASDGVPFAIFRGNAAGGVQRPLMRISKVNLLDASGQPTGSIVPYAKPVEILSNSFQNVSNGVKTEVEDASLGLVSFPAPTTLFGSPAFVFTGPGNLRISWEGGLVVTSFPAGTISLTSVINSINAQSNLAVGYSIAVAMQYDGEHFVGIVPVGPNTNTQGSSRVVLNALFGDSLLDVNDIVHTSRDIRSMGMSGTWADVKPPIDGDLDSVHVLDGLQSGLYKGPAVSSTTDLVLVTEHDFAPELSVAVRVGYRSLGSARLYFLDPTSMEVDQDTVFTVVDLNKNVLNFKPDPLLSRQIYPALPNGSKPLDGVSVATDVFHSSGTDFIRKGVRAGDILRIDYVPVAGAPIADPVPGLALKQLRISYDNQPDRFVTFTNDSPTPGAVSRDGVAAQINAAIGERICRIQQDGADYELVFNPTKSIILREQNTSPYSGNVTLGFNDLADTSNWALCAGDYEIVEVAPGSDVNKLTLDSSLPFAETSQQFSVLRKGEQRIVSTTMAKQTTSGGLYYWDVELVSEGPGNLWNLDAGEEMVVAGYRSDGYFLTTPDSNTTFSPAEQEELILSRSLMEVGVDDDPDNATQLTGLSLSINYEHSSLVQGVQNFVGAETERVINSSPLARGLVPHYVRFDLNYFGGSQPSEVTPTVENFILNLPPDASLYSSEVQDIVAGKGATYIQNPISLLAVVYNFDRSVVLVRSQDALSTGRLSAFIPERVNLTRNTS